MGLFLYFHFNRSGKHAFVLPLEGVAFIQSFWSWYYSTTIQSESEKKVWTFSECNETVCLFYYTVCAAGSSSSVQCLIHIKQFSSSFAQTLVTTLNGVVMWLVSWDRIHFFPHQIWFMFIHLTFGSNSVLSLHVECSVVWFPPPSKTSEWDEFCCHCPWPRH